MIILDTNIISEIMRPQPNVNVINWLNQQPVEILFLTSISITETYFGLYRMDEGKRKTGLLQTFDKILAEMLNQKFLEFTVQNTMTCAKFLTVSEKHGLNMGFADAQIASIAHFYQATLATRNVKDFAYCDISIINPFNY